MTLNHVCIALIYAEFRYYTLQKELTRGGCAEGCAGGSAALHNPRQSCAGGGAGGCAKEVCLLFVVQFTALFTELS